MKLLKNNSYLNPNNFHQEFNEDIIISIIDNSDVFSNQLKLGMMILNHRVQKDNNIHPLHSTICLSINKTQL